MIRRYRRVSDIVKSVRSQEPRCRSAHGVADRSAVAGTCNDGGRLPGIAPALRKLDDERQRAAWERRKAAGAGCHPLVQNRATFWGLARGRPNTLRLSQVGSGGAARCSLGAAWVRDAQTASLVLH
jgi:hypothetical protein